MCAWTASLRHHGELMPLWTHKSHCLIWPWCFKLINARISWWTRPVCLPAWHITVLIIKMRSPDLHFPSVLMPTCLYLHLLPDNICFGVEMPVELLVDLFQVHTPAINNHSLHFPAVEHMELQWAEDSRCMCAEVSVVTSITRCPSYLKS